MTGRLTTGGHVVLDAAGAGSLTLGPGRQGERWNVARYTTSGNSAVEPVLQVFRGSALLDTTKRGNADVSEQAVDLIMWAGESLRFTYTGGSAGVTMTVYVEGTVDYGATS